MWDCSSVWSRKVSFTLAAWCGAVLGQFWIHISNFSSRAHGCQRHETIGWIFHDQTLSPKLVFPGVHELKVKGFIMNSYWTWVKTHLIFREQWAGMVEQRKHSCKQFWEQITQLITHSENCLNSGLSQRSFYVYYRECARYTCGQWQWTSLWWLNFLVTSRSCQHRLLDEWNKLSSYGANRTKRFEWRLDVLEMGKEFGEFFGSCLV